jgi:hypothetical protein
MDASSHISKEQLEGYSLNRLEPAEADMVEEHLLLCEACRQQLREQDEFHATLRTALRQTPDSPRLRAGRIPRGIYRVGEGPR